MSKRLPLLLLLCYECDHELFVLDIELNSGVPLKVTSALGSLVDLSCPIEGYPQVMYSWIKGNKQLGHRRGLTVKLDKGEDFGNYTCNGKNGFGSKKVTFEIYNDGKHFRIEPFTQTEKFRHIMFL